MLVATRLLTSSRASCLACRPLASPRFAAYRRTSCLPFRARMPGDAGNIGTAGPRNASEPPEGLIEFVTDVEGNALFWQSFLDASRVVVRDEQGLRVRPGCQLVFGGDTIDRGVLEDAGGAGDLRVLEDLVGLKKRCPESVELIFGNRDANKMRLLVELDESVLRERRSAFWAPRKEDAPDIESRAARLKDYIFPSTMGAPLAFEARRAELRARNLPHGNEDVAESYLQTIRPGGVLAEYLSMAKLIVVRGDVAFVHGAFTDSNLGFVPPAPGAPATDSGSTVGDFRRWIDQLNAFAASEVAAFLTQTQDYLSGAEPLAWSSTGGYHHPQPGSRLAQYCNGKLPTEADARSVIYSSFASRGSPRPIDSGPQRALSAAGIRFVLSGHQPYADAPCFSLGEGMIACSLDTSYAANVVRPDPASKEGFDGIDAELLPLDAERRPAKNNTRGAALAIGSVVPGKEGEPSRLFVRGSLADCSTYDCEVVPDGLLGKKTEDGWLVTLMDVTDPAGKQHDFYLTKGEGYTFKGRFASRSEVMGSMSSSL
ncbi:hypothetical protein DFJ74DRAFT_690279 [Hyaloraphidium curvatum]|nr:hypothetical protein DFJ74DRAFT_690279 [Hyaloraphidium curvatum]